MVAIKRFEIVNKRIDELEKKVSGAYDLIRLLQLKIEKLEKEVRDVK